MGRFQGRGQSSGRGARGGRSSSRGGRGHSRSSNSSSNSSRCNNSATKTKLEERWSTGSASQASYYVTITRSSLLIHNLQHQILAPVTRFARSQDCFLASCWVLRPLCCFEAKLSLTSCTKFLQLPQTSIEARCELRNLKSEFLFHKLPEEKWELGAMIFITSGDFYCIFDDDILVFAVPIDADCIVEKIG